MMQTEAALRAVFERAVKRQQDKSAGARNFPPDPIEDAYLEGCRDMAGWILGEYDGEDMLLALLTDAGPNTTKQKRRTPHAAPPRP